MKRQRRLLLADNNQDFLETRAELLSREGFLVVTADSVMATEAALREHWFHCVILDKRLTNDDDETDNSGAHLALAEEFAFLPKIISTGFPEYQTVRNVLRHSSVIDFVAKQDGLEPLLAALNEVDRRFPLNLELKILFEQPGSLLQLLDQIDPQLVQQHALECLGEFDYLLCRYFANATELVLGRLLIRRPNWLLLEAFMRDRDGHWQQCALACGRSTAVQQEYQAYQTLIKPLDHSPVSALEPAVVSLRYAVVGYRLNDTRIEQLQPLRDFALQPAVELPQLIQQLCHKYLRFWHGRRRNGPDLNELAPLAALPGANGLPALREQLDTCVKRLCAQASHLGILQIRLHEDRLYWQAQDLPPQPLVHPRLILERLEQAALPVQRHGIIHGDLGPDTILVDATGRSWPLAFQQTDTGSLPGEFAWLLTRLRLELNPQQDLDAYQRSEAELLTGAAQAATQAAAGSSAERQLADSVYQQAAALIGELREQDFLLAQLWAVLRYLLSYDPAQTPTRRCIQPYLRALLRADQLQQVVNSARHPVDLPRQATDSLWLDIPNHRLWVRGHEVELSPQEYQLTELLWEQRPQQGTREQLLKRLGESTTDLGSERDRIDSAMSRLRSKINKASGGIKYIKTRRGHGYWLELQQPADPAAS